MVPILETERLRLRAARAGDAAAHGAMLSDPNVVRYLGGAPLTAEDAWRKLLGSTGGWIVAAMGYWVVEAQGDGAFVGIIGFSDFHRDIEPSIRGLPEMGWIFARAAQGRGLAYEAGRAALDWADAELRAPLIPAIIHPDNRRSIALAQRLGFVAGEATRYRDDPIVIYRRHG